MNNISIALTTYNGEQFIYEQIQSLLNQTVKAKQIVIIDDDSSDNTIKEIELCKEKYKDNSIEIFKNKENIGYIRNFIKAIEKCDGDIIFLCDQDDVWEVNKIETIMNIFETKESIECVASSFTYIDENGIKTHKRKKYGRINNNMYIHNAISEGEVIKIHLQDVLIQNMCQGCSLAFTKKIRRILLENYVEDIPHDRQIDCIAASLDKMYFINQSLFRYRIHSNNTIGIQKQIEISKAMDYVYRVKIAEESIKLCNMLKKIDQFQDINLEEIKKIDSFLHRYLSAIYDKKIIDMLFINKKYYKRLKSIKGRMMDILYCLR